MILSRVTIEKLMRDPSPKAKQKPDGTGFVESQTPITGWMDLLDAYNLHKLICHEFGVVISIEEDGVPGAYIFGLQHIEGNTESLRDALPAEIRGRIQAVIGDAALSVKSRASMGRERKSK